MKRDFLSLLDLSEQELDLLIKRALKLKKERSKGHKALPLKGKTVGLIFEKSSTRTRVSFEVGVTELGGNALFLSSKDLQMGRGEPIKDTARVLSRYIHGIVYRCYSHETLKELAQFTTIPVINGLSDYNHPVQVLSDLFTLYEHFGDYKNLSVAWIGDGNNMANAWIEAHILLGFELKMACPKGYEPDKALLKKVSKHKNFLLTDKPEEAAKNVDVLNTDVWVSMGDEAEAIERKKAFKGYQINKKLVALANKCAVVLHCLPAYRGQEITDDIIEAENSIIFEQAENRLHAQKALLEFLIK